MMFRKIFNPIAQSIGIGSFIYLLNAVLGIWTITSQYEIISIWVVCVFIGLVTSLYNTTKIPNSIIAVLLFGTGIIGFTIIAILNQWIEANISDMLIYSAFTLVLMLISFGTFYILSFIDSKKINKKLNEKEFN